MPDRRYSSCTAKSACVGHDGLMTNGGGDLSTLSARLRILQLVLAGLERLSVHDYDQVALRYIDEDAERLLHDIAPYVTALLGERVTADDLRNITAGGAGHLLA